MIGFYAAGAMGQGGGGGGGGDFPNILTPVATAFTTASLTQSVPMPVTVSAGDLLILQIGGGSNNSATYSTPSGWILLASPASNAPRTGLFYRVADGSEAGGAVLVTSSASERAVAIVNQIAAGSYSGAPEAATIASGSSDSPDPGALSPSWGALDTLWIASYHAQNGPVAIGFPYPDGNASAGTISGGSSHCNAASCWTKQNTSSLDPGTFLMASARNWRAITIAVRPA